MVSRSGGEHPVPCHLFSQWVMAWRIGSVMPKVSHREVGAAQVPARWSPPATPAAPPAPSAMAAHRPEDSSLSALV